MENADGKSITTDGTPAEDRYGRELEAKQNQKWVCSRCGYRNVTNNKVCMGAEMGDGRCGKPKEPEHGTLVVELSNKVKPKCKTCKGFEDKYCVQTGTMIPCPDCQQTKLKPLAQYLTKYIEHEDAATLFTTVDYSSWREFFEQALDAYESTENVTIKIERV